MKTLLLLLFCSIGMLAQQSPPDTLVWLKPPQAKIKSLKTIKNKGEELAAHGFTTITEHVSLVRELPQGQLATVTFYFNSGLINLNKKDFNIEYKDTTLRLMVYAVGADGKPGSLLTPTPLYFMVKADHRGALELDLSALNLQTQPQLFIGMAATTEHTGEQIVLKVRENKTALSYTKNKGSNTWTEYDDGSGFKFDVKMSVGVKSIY